jgi:hypothetical protein
VALEILHQLLRHKETLAELEIQTHQLTAQAAVAVAEALVEMEAAHLLALVVLELLLQLQVHQ